jgi:hypothetical protein
MSLKDTDVADERGVVDQRRRPRLRDGFDRSKGEKTISLVLHSARAFSAFLRDEIDTTLL